MNEVNRSALIVKPKQPFVDWLKFVDPTDDKITVENVNDDSPLYLIPECGSKQEFEDWMTQNFEFIFEEQLNDWFTDERVWPQNRTLDVFHQWFDCRLHSLVFDLERTMDPRCPRPWNTGMHSDDYRDGVADRCGGLPR
jgi:hypothetical protein